MPLDFTITAFESHFIQGNCFKNVKNMKWLTIYHFIDDRVVVRELTI
jgi:hypothetical protein